MKAIIIDDERLARTELKRLLQDFPEIEIVDEAANAEDGILKIVNHHPDLVFLDIQMPGKTGFDMLAELEKTPQIIFTTAYDEFALKAFEVNALDYLLKPVEPKRLADAIQKLNVGEVRDAKLEGENTNNSLLTENDQVFVKDGEKCWFVQLGEIRLFESVGNYAKVFFGANKPCLLYTSDAADEEL
jgi:two-component system LytT family response regulator